MAQSLDPSLHKNVRLPPGVRDFLPRATARRIAISTQLLARFERWGYQRIITPQFEVADVIERGLGASAAQSAIRFIEPEMGEVALLRPDITPQVARIAATRLDETGGPLRLSYQATVVRAGRAARGQREILQTGVELIGASAPAGDSEIVALAAEVMLAANPFSSTDRVRLEVGHVAPAQSILAAVESPSLRNKLTRALADRDRSAIRALTVQLPGKQAAALALLPTLSGSIDVLEPLAADAPKSIAHAFAELRAVLAGAAALAPDAMRRVDVVVDLGEVGGFPYYTGVRVAGWLDGVGKAVLVGGRYDKLVARFGRDRKATGFAVDIEALAEAHAATGASAIASSGVLIVGHKDATETAPKIASALRRAGVRAAVEVGGLRSRRSALRYGAASGFESVLFLDESGGELVVATSPYKDSLRIAKTIVRGVTRGDRSAVSRLRASVRTQGRKS